MILILDKSSQAPDSLHVHLRAQLAQGTGHLIACTDCLEHVHCAPWLTNAEFLARRATFALKHRHEIR